MTDTDIPEHLIEAIARAKCRARGIDPDRTGGPYSAPVWRLYQQEAKDFIAMYNTIEFAKENTDAER